MTITTPAIAGPSFSRQTKLQSIDTDSIPFQNSSAPFSAPANFATQAEEQPLDVIPTRAGRKLCVRHKQMADQNVNQKLQNSLDALPTTERSAVTQLWSTFSSAPHAKRKLILEGILTMCCFSQLSHISDSLNQIIRIDPFSLLPREVNLRILGYLDAITLGRAAQVSKTWKALADDDLLWRRMCGQHIDRKCEKCGWGLPLLERRRLKVELNERSPAAAMGVGGHVHGHDHSPQEVVTREEALGAAGAQAAAVKTCDSSAVAVAATVASTGNGNGGGVLGNGNGNGLKRPLVSSDSLMKPKRIRLDGSGSESEAEEGSGKNLSREVRLTRPWKSVYCERLVVERNWRKGRCKTQVLKGHEDGVMCLQYHTALTSPSYPVLITGSYDRTVRVWNLDTGEIVRTLHGHTRAVRALQFDQMLLFTGAMDGTVRMWNWRAGECLRVLEGHTDGVVSLSYNGYLLASGSADSTIQVWNFRSGNKFVLRGHDDWVNSVVLWDGKTSPGDMDPTLLPSFSISKVGNKRGVSPMPSGSIGLTNGQGENSSQQLPEIDSGTMLFSASDDCTVKLWDLETQTCIRTFSGHKAQVQTIKVIMIDMSEEEIQANRRLQRKRSTTPPNSNNGFQPASTFSPRGTSLEIIGEAMDNAPEGFDTSNHTRASSRDQVEPRIYVHDTDENRLEAENVDSKGNNTQKKAVLVTGSLDGTVKVWCVETGVERATLFGHIEGVWGVDIDALRIASASDDRTVKVWDRESGKCIHTFTGHRGAVTSVQLSDDMIVSGSDDGDVMVWNFAPNVAPATPGVSGQIKAVV